MLASISPVGEHSRHQRWSVTVIAYLLASAWGGGTIGGLMGAIGAGLGTGTWGTSSLLVLAVVTAASAAVDAGRLPIRIPSRRRQVDERWLTEYRGWVYGAGFGLQLGAAVFTIIPSAITYAALMAAALTGNLVHGAVIGATFGAMRAAPLLMTGFVRTPGGLQRLHQQLDAARMTIGHVTVAAQVAVAAVAVITVLGASQW